MPTTRHTLTEAQRRELRDRFENEAAKYQRLAGAYARTGDLAYARELEQVAIDYIDHADRLDFPMPRVA